MTEYSREFLAALRPLPKCARCSMGRCTTEPEGSRQSPICGGCAVKEFIDDPAWRRYRPWNVVHPAQQLVSNNPDSTLVEWFAITKPEAAGLRRRVMAQLADPYDGQDDFLRSHDLAIAELRKRHEAGR